MSQLLRYVTQTLPQPDVVVWNALRGLKYNKEYLTDTKQNPDVHSDATQGAIAKARCVASLEAVPTINQLRSSLETIRVEELQKALSRMGPDFSARERKVVEALSKGIINKILHTPVTQLRAPQKRQDRQQALQTVERLFDLEPS